MKTFSWILLSFFTVFKLQAQDVQVTLADPCLTIAKKSTIIINDNAVAATNTPSTTVTESNTVNFTLTTSVNTSAGVYNASGNLVRTLWNGVRYDAGSYKAVWSGIMDDGTQAPPGTYQVKVLTNNVQYTWEGVIGNTSASQTNNLFKSYGGNTCFAFVGTKCFYGQFFYEGGTNSRYFNTNEIGKSYDLNVGVHACTIDNATDGNIVVWACFDQYQGNGTAGSQSNYIFASKAIDNTPVAFTNESAHNSGRENEAYTHFIGLETVVGTIYTGVAINNNFIFATKSSGQLLVFNKTTGAVVQTLTYSNPGRLAAGSNNELWMIVDGVLKKFTVNATTGAVTDAGLTISATNPVSVKISSDNSTVLVIDAGTQQVKAFSNSTGAQLWALGQQGGYDTNGPAVTTNKFMFDHANFAIASIAYQPDGSFWVGDIGNYRTLHFNADRTYKEQIMYMPSSRSTNADPNNPTRIFADELEFQRDYSKPLDNGANGSWKLVNNWKIGTTLDGYRKFNQVVTLSNGHTYATGDNGNFGGYLYDLTNSGAKLIRSNFDGSNLRIEADGSLVYWANNNNQNITVHKQSLQSFNATTFEPLWGNDITVATTPTFSTTSPYFFTNNTRGSSTNPNRYFFFSPLGNTSISYILGGADLGMGNHLGAIKAGGSTWDWQASKSTFFDYHGDYPRNGDYDLGNNDITKQHSENCQALVQGSNVFWNVNGEFWKANSPAVGEVNIWNHFNEDGLLIGNFGKTGLDAALTGNAGFAGNVFSTALVKVAGDFYIYHCDENQHGGVHSWHITGLNTIAEQSIPITVSAAIVPISDPSSLMSGLPYRSSTFTGGNGWTATPAGFVMKTYVNTYAKDDPSISINGNSTQIVNRSLNNTATLSSWTLSGSLSFVGTEPTIGGNNYNYLELVDVAGKVICRYYEFADTRNSYNRQILINNTSLFQGANGSTEFLKTYNNFSFSYANGTIVFKIGSFPTATVSTVIDPGADMSKPAFLRVNQGSPGNQNHAMDFCKLRFTGK